MRVVRSLSLVRSPAPTNGRDARAWMKRAIDGRPCAVGSGSIRVPPTAACNAVPRFPNKEGYLVLLDYNFVQ